MKNRLWRCTRPGLSASEKEKLVSRLMAARRAVRDAKKSADELALTKARAAVNEAKVELGERGPVWWSDGAPDYNRFKIENTPYADWWKSLSPEI